jgi:uncharacterized RDD family membrane protein YckC
MFIIIGGDGREYGPATVEQIRAWIAAGRANLETPAKRMGVDEWHRLSDFPELFSADRTSPAPAPAGDGLELANRGRRLLGALADGALESLCWLPTSLAMMRAWSEMAASHEADPTVLMDTFWNNTALSLPYLGALLLVQVVLLTLRSQSLGNLLAGTRIVRASDGTPGGFLHAFLLRGCLARVLRLVPILGAIFWITDSLFIFRADRRCLHDLMAGTKVVRT